VIIVCYSNNKAKVMFRLPMIHSAHAGSPTKITSKPKRNAGNAL
jgi:hypothetical protein